MPLTPAETALAECAAATPMRGLVERWAAINSGTANLPGLATIADALADAFATLPATPQLVAGPPEPQVTPAGEVVEVERGRHLRLTVRPDAPVQVLLTGHMDTVYGADHPFQSVRETAPGVVNGPGVADMKGGLAVMLAALAAWEAGPEADRLGYELLINSDEETGSATSAPLIAAAARGKRAGLTFEPALDPDGMLADARPGSGNFALVVTGRAAHAGRNPGDGRNAVVAAADLALRLAALGRPGLLVNPARIEGGGPNNVVPAHAVLRVNLRPTAPADADAARVAIEDAVAAVAREHDVAVVTHGGFGRPPKPLNDAAERLFALVQAAGADLGQTIGRRASGGVCDGNLIAAAGVPSVDTLGVRGGAIHSADEYLIVASLAERAALAAVTLSRLAAR